MENKDSNRLLKEVRFTNDGKTAELVFEYADGEKVKIPWMDVKKDYYRECPSCGGYLLWQSDFMRSELGFCDDGDDEDCVVNIYSCTNCGAYVEVHNLPPELDEEDKSETVG